MIPTADEVIFVLEQYLFVEYESPKNLHNAGDTRVSLRSYLDTLKNHYIALNELKEKEEIKLGKDDPLLARVEYADYGVIKFSRYSGYGYMNSETSII